MNDLSHLPFPNAFTKLWHTVEIRAINPLTTSSQRNFTRLSRFYILQVNVSVQYGIYLNNSYHALPTGQKDMIVYLYMKRSFKDFICILYIQIPTEEKPQLLGCYDVAATRKQ